VYKVNPPLRSERDVMALREGLADGTIDIIATDHAPHSSENKECEWQAAAFGMLGLETAFSIGYQTMVQSGLISFATLIDRMSIAPARIAGYTNHGGTIHIGESANLALIDRDTSWQVDRETVQSKSRNTPFHGRELPATIDVLFFNGHAHHVKAL
jgi:dihydroorotase